jgi:beta-mannosidase
MSLATRRIDLGGTWKYTPLAYVTLMGDGQLHESAENPPPPGTMTLPCNWQSAGLDSFDGTVRFEREVVFDGLQSNESSVWLMFRGVDYFARVWVNGEEVGSHAGYFQPFGFDLTGVLRVGTNHLAVDVTCPLEEPGTVWPDHKHIIKGILNHWDCRPGSWDLKTGQTQNSGGIWNGVFLEMRPGTYIDHVHVTTRLVPRSAPAGYEIGLGLAVHDADTTSLMDGTSRQAIVLFDVELAGQPGAYDLTAMVGNNAPVIRQIHFKGESERHTIAVQISEPQLWWTWDLGEPHLEDVKLTLSNHGTVISERHFRTGLREVHFDAEKGWWYLNGVRFFVRGTNIVPTLWLGEYDDTKIARDIQLLRDAYVNGARMCVHVNRDELYSALDEAGIIVWQDFPLQWGYTEDPDFMNEAVRQIKDMVRMLAHHPCIALWCCQNESSFHNKFILDPVLAAAVATEDATRPIRPTSEFFEHTYVGWYYGHYRDYSALPATPVNSEFGAQALPSLDEMRAMVGDTWPPDWEALAYHDFQYDQTFHVAGVEMGNNWEEFVHNSQSYQAKLLKFALETYRRAKYERLGGLFQFMFMDCWPAITWSVVGHDRVPKMGYQALKEAFQPVLIGMTLQRDTQLLGIDIGQHARPLVIRPWVVNDRHETLRGCTYHAVITSSETRLSLPSSEAFDVPADGIVERAPTTIWAPRTEDKPGTYTLELLLNDAAGAVISRNHYEIEALGLPASIGLNSS